MVRTPTSATRADACRADASRAAAVRGFTLVELLVVLALLALLIAVVPASLGRLQESMHYRDAIRSVVVDLRRARQQAVAAGREQRFTVDLANRRYGAEGGPERELPEPLQMQVVVAGVEWSARQVGAIRFLPQGGATGGTVAILRPSGNGMRITVDWLTGSVTQVAVEAP